MDDADRGGMPRSGVPDDDAVTREREKWDSGKTVKDRVYETAIALREPTTVAAVAERADCSTEAARSHLSWFAELGVVEWVGDGTPARYRRNQAYFDWKRADELRRDLGPAELDERRSDLLARDRSYQERYDAVDPDDVAALDHADPGDHDALESVFRDVNDWLTVRADLRTVERARRLQRDDSPATA